MIDPFKVHRALRARGVLGINARNRDYIYPYNPRRNFPAVDDKVVTKAIAIAAGVRVPEQYAVLEYQGHIHLLRKVADKHEEFVIKPARGSGGGGILVIGGHGRTGLRKASGDLMTWDEVHFHVSNIFGGLFSLGGGSDRVLIEQRLHTDSSFDLLAYKGVPDVRVIVFRGVPIAAMLRLPTSLSDGKANLHMGGVGAGVDLPTGTTTRAVCKGEAIDRHPDFETPLAGFVVPHWMEVLELSARLGGSIGLGYVGVDLVIDRDLGPTMLELNARPGIAIQIANGMGLAHGLRRVRALKKVPEDPAERRTLAIRIAEEMRPAPAASPARSPDLRSDAIDAAAALGSARP
jgi:alpha-L-glutamate ligase-like protein